MTALVINTPIRVIDRLYFISATFLTRWNVFNRTVEFSRGRC